MPIRRSVSDIRANLLRPALTSHYEVQFTLPPDVISNTGLDLNIFDQGKLNLLCSEASLPGSNLATLEINNDFTGVTERHAHRRIYDDRVDFTFYVDAEKYLPIIVFETWMKYISGEAVAIDEKMRGVSSNDRHYFYRMRYPNKYILDQGLKITKFERDYSNRLEYEFIRSYPISISSMPVSYDSSSLLKCTVSMTYIRYIVKGFKATPGDPKSIAEGEQQSSVIPEFANVDFSNINKFPLPESYLQNPKFAPQFSQREQELGNQFFNQDIPPGVLPGSRFQNQVEGGTGQSPNNRVFGREGIG